jgi:hypothetical protein
MMQLTALVLGIASATLSIIASVLVIVLRVMELARKARR